MIAIISKNIHKSEARDLVIRKGKIIKLKAKGDREGRPDQRRDGSLE